MNHSPLSRWTIVLLLSALISLNAQVLGDLKVAVIRVSFPVQDYPGVSGNGDFLYTAKPIECGDYTIDPPPHDKNYFQSHLIAVDNYYRSVSYGKFGIDLQNSTVFPSANESSYLINTPMNYYHEISQDEVHEKRITELLRDATNRAYEVDNIDFSQFDLITIVHPGVGQDFNLPFLDPTPEDIPSTYVDKNMVNTHLGGPIQVGRMFIPNGIVIPETQNHLFYDDSIFNQLSSPCDIQYSITGTFAMMIGFAVGLPPLWDLESGLSGVGVFSLMDQGSNNGRGIIPAPPDAWTRIYAGWETPSTIKYPGNIAMSSDTKIGIIKIPISTDEYFLIENRNNWYRNRVSVDSAQYVVWEKTDEYPPFIHVLMDSVGVKKNDSGVITEILNYNLGLPASGLLIWHIDEKKIREGLDLFSINSDRKHRGIDLEEADGAQDMGYISNLFTDPSSGYWGDMWFADNPEYFRANAEGSMDFSSFTYPNTKSNSGANSGINISNISKAGENMSFTLSSSYDVAYLKDENKSILFQWDVDGDGDLDFIGAGDSLWWGDDLNDINAFYKNEGKDLQVCVAQNTNPTALATLRSVDNDWVVEWFEFDPTIKEFVRIWENKKPVLGSIQLLKANDQQVWIKEKEFLLTITKDEIENLLMDNDPFVYRNRYKGESYYFDSTGVRKGWDPTMGNLNFEGDFKYFSLIDLENDGYVEIVLTDYKGNIHVLDSKYIYKYGFPIETSSVGPVLGLDLIGDKSPELVYESIDGNIIVLNMDGEVMERFSSGNELMGLGFYNGNHSIITDHKIISYKKSLDYRGNAWNYTYATPDNSRLLRVDTTMTPKYFILDKDQSYAYPNPSYGENVIFRVQIGWADYIEINIYDIAGFPIKKLEEQLFKISDIPGPGVTLLSPNAGAHEIKWDVSNIQSGVYLARVVVSKDGKSEEKIIKVGVIK
ncbi:MAG: hypothetical protein ISR82_02335 [Candidatus Marinimicrobia bacterium]|nr:hypothetical protein [Candidatus Neomarinimicrobiota bacterium]MBL7010045.1 hypothetical protein [Candidatus Neomarinimicrobiota bacterium]MBL7030314.1 hypothetical protein [Candidatus Neomarinimicrobiota bacterium]